MIMERIDVRIIQVNIIIETVCDYFETPREIIFLKDRHTETKEVRQWIHYMCKKNTNLSLQKIAYYTSKQHHATVINSCIRIENLIETEQEFRMNYQNLDELIKEKFNEINARIDEAMLEEIARINELSRIKYINSKRLIKAKAAALRNKMPLIIKNEITY